MTTRRALPSPMKIDPTKTTTLRRVFCTGMDRRMEAFKQSLVHLIVTEDAFGLLPSNLQEKSVVANTRFKFHSDSDKLKQFAAWIAEQTQQKIIESNENYWWDRYIQEGYQKGAGRAFDSVRYKDLHKADKPLGWYKGTKDEFLRSSFAQPIQRERIKVLASRVFTELKGVNDTMAQQLTRGLADGMTQGKSPREVARDLSKTVDGIGKVRARAIARTETIRSHAEGTLDALENMGVTHVGVMVEWSTAGFNVCPLCQDMQGVVLSIAEARGMIPRHTNCKCAFIPANVGEDQKSQIRGKSAVDAAIQKSVKDESPKSKLSMKERIAKSNWQGADRTVDKTRPKSILDGPAKKSQNPIKPPKAEKKQAPKIEITKASLKELVKNGWDWSKISKAVEANSVVDSEYTYPTLGDQEKFKKFTLDHLTVRYASATPEIMSQMLHEYVTGELPEKLWKNVDTITFSHQRNKQDSHWEKEYGIPGFRSSATSGGRVITSYGGTNMTKGTLIHEMGHSLATAEFGSATPLGKYALAQKLEKPVSEYGSKSPAEDFAEAVKLYYTDREALKTKFPHKYAALKEILDAKPRN